MRKEDSPKSECQQHQLLPLQVAHSIRQSEEGKGKGRAAVSATSQFLPSGLKSVQAWAKESSLTVGQADLGAEMLVCLVDRVLLQRTSLR